jgi:hypothetical protein
MATQPGPHLSLTEQLAHCTVRIEADGGTGTGFFFRFALEGDSYVPAIITNKHVVEGAKHGRFVFTLTNDDGTPNFTSHVPVEFNDFEKHWVAHPDPDIDLCAMPTASILAWAREAKHRFFYRSIDFSLVPTADELADLNPVKDITMVGYPNGLWDQTNNMPIFRRGITATHPRLPWNGKPEFLIDAACFPGSSGSPVFLLNQGGYVKRSGGTQLGSTRIKLLGVLYAGPQHTVEGEIAIVSVPIQSKPIALSNIPNNLGIVVRAEKLKELEAKFVELAK